MSRVRLLFVANRVGLGGAERLLADLLARLDQSRFEPVLVCLRELAALGERIAASGVRSYEQLTTSGRDPRVIGRLTEIMRAEQTDVVCTIGTGGDRSFWGRIAARIAGVPVVISCPHSMGLPDRFEFSNRLLTGWTDGFIAVAERQKRYLTDDIGLPAGKIHVVYNGVDTDRFSPSAAPPSVRAELRLPLGAPTAVLVSKLRLEKNIALFLRAARRVREHLPAARFVIVGDGPERESLVSLSRELGLVPSLHFAGVRDDVERVLRAADVLVLSSRFEALPLTILEAFACGKPAVSTDVGAVREMVRPGETGFLAPSEDEAALAAAMRRVLADPALAARLGRNARQLVESQFSLESMVRGYERVFDRLLAKKGRRRGSGSIKSPHCRIAPVAAHGRSLMIHAAAESPAERDRAGWSLLPESTEQEAIA